MERQKKTLSLQVKENPEVIMSDAQVLESLETEIDKTRAELEKTKLELEEKKSQLKAIPMREVDADEMVLIKKQVAMSSEKTTLKAKIEKEKAHDSQMVTGKFINRRAPGMSAKLTYMKYETDPVKWYNMEDGKVYTIPRGFADQINDHYYTPHFIQKQGPMDPNAPASQIHNVDTSNKKYACVPTNF